MRHKETAAVWAVIICFLGLLALGGVWARSSEEDDRNSKIRQYLRRNSETSVRADILHAKAYVESFPLIVGLRLAQPEQSNSGFQRTIYLRDLASTFERSSGFEFLMLEDGENSPLFLFGRRLSEPFDAPDYRTLAPGEGMGMWIDLAQLIVPTKHLEKANKHPQVGVFPREGSTKLAWTSTKRGSASSPIVEFDVREAEVEEIAVAEVLQSGGVGRSWFPASFFVDEDVPDAAHLPTETRRVVAFIDVMRKALRNSNQGLITIQSYDPDLWGYMAELIAMVEYECLRDTGRDSEAASLRSGSPARWSEVFDMVGRGDGLVRRLRRVRDGEADYLGRMNQRALERALERDRKQQERE